MFKPLFITLTLLALSACGSPDPTSTGAEGGDGLSGGLGGGITPISPSGDAGGITPLDEGGEEDLSGEEIVDEGVAEEEYVEEEYVDESGEIPAEEVTEEGGEELPLEPDAGSLPDTGTMPPDLEVLPPFAPPGLGGATDYSTEGSYKVDQDTFNQWQAVNLTSDGSAIYIAASDLKSPAKGTVIRMGTSGEDWKDIGKSFLSTITFGAAGYKMKETITAITLDSAGELLVTDASERVYALSTDGGPSEKALSLVGSRDVVSAGGFFYAATTSGIQKFDSNFGIPAHFGSVKPTGGLGADSTGLLYAVVGNSIQKFDSSGQAGEMVGGLSSPLDVAVDASGNVFVLESGVVKWFNANGESKGSFGSGELISPKAICVDSSGAVYVADAGNDHSDSQVIKFSIGGAEKAAASETEAGEEESAEGDLGEGGLDALE
ncbi:MAG: hypothetical protein ACO1RX_08620 [Candidatus Sericytochromatia bacterium]